MSEEAKRLMVLRQIANRAQNLEQEWDMLDALGLMSL